MFPLLGTRFFSEHENHSVIFNVGETVFVPGFHIVHNRNTDMPDYVHWTRIGHISAPFTSNIPCSRSKNHPYSFLSLRFVLFSQNLRRQTPLPRRNAFLPSFGYSPCLRHAYSIKTINSVLEERSVRYLRQSVEVYGTYGTKKQFRTERALY